MKIEISLYKYTRNGRILIAPVIIDLVLVFANTSFMPNDWLTMSGVYIVDQYYRVSCIQLPK